MNDKYIINVIIGSVLLVFAFNYIRCDISVTGRCGRPALPAKATRHQISPERSRFENKEKVVIQCKKNEFPLQKYEVHCNKGHWTGRRARCGRHIDANVVHLNISECETQTNQLLVSQPLNQSSEAPAGHKPLRPNSFHSLRLREDTKTSAKGYDCYNYKISFERRVQIWFLLVDIWVELNDTKLIPQIRPDLGKYRECELVKTHTQVIGKDIVFGYYFICDLKNASDVKRDESEMSESISFKIKTNFTERLGLEAVFIGDIFTDTIGSNTVVPDCGQLEVINIGVNGQEEMGLTYISCNDSFIDTSGQNISHRSPNGNPKHMFVCDWNGQWTGQWPVCEPKVSCSRDGIVEEMDSSVMIEEIGNVYHLNESKWFAINESFIRYSCLYENDIMIGKNIRICLNGKWNSKAPYCTKTGMSGTSIALIMIVVLIVFVLIVLFVFRTHSRRVNRELRETREEINGSQRKRFSEEFYADFKSDFYDNSDVVPKTLDYETVEYDSTAEQPRYEMPPHSNPRPPSPQYLRMLSIND